MKQAAIPFWLCLSFTLGTASGVFADSWTCTQAELTRQVLTFYPNEPARLPCKVFYSKPTEKVIPRALWKARYDEDFCERKAAEFVNQLEAWGWRCTIDDPGLNPS